MNARALLGIAVASLLGAACGERVQLGSDGPLPAPPDPDVCLNVPCGEPCRFDDTCSSTDCPPSPGGLCDLHGVCTLAMPLLCVDPGTPSCVGLPCGTLCPTPWCDPCEPCDPTNPADPNCTVSTEPPMTCDAFGQCQIGKVHCPL